METLTSSEGDLAQALLLALAALLLLALLSGLVLLALAWQRLARLRVPPETDLFTTLRAVPLGLVVALDLIDFSLDLFGAPIVWAILNRFRLRALRDVAALEALIPFTQPIPTLTLAWLAVRVLNLGAASPEAEMPNVLETERVGPGRYAARPRRE